jgi:hypothetical protein
MFTEEEVQEAKKMRDYIIEKGNDSAKAIYMAGEIVMWDEMRQKDLSNNLGMIDALVNPTEDETKVENTGGQIYITPQKPISDNE